MRNLSNPKILKLTPIATALTTIVAGAAGYIDTDVSATTGTDISRLWLVSCRPPAGALTTHGVRAHGSAIDNKVFSTGTTFVSYVDSNGHMDFYRDAAIENRYSIIGYLQ